MGKVIVVKTDVCGRTVEGGCGVSDGGVLELSVGMGGGVLVAVLVNVLVNVLGNGGGTDITEMRVAVDVTVSESRISVRDVPEIAGRAPTLELEFANGGLGAF